MASKIVSRFRKCNANVNSAEDMHFVWFSISTHTILALQGTLNSVASRKVEDHENHVRLIYLTTVPNMG